jgi:hypothetical protein
MRRLIRSSLMAFLSLVAVSATYGCSDPPSAPHPVARIPWGPLGTTGGNHCGDTDVRISDPESILKTDTLPNAQGYDECPPSGTTAEMICPQVIIVQLTYQGEIFVGSGASSYGGAWYVTYGYFARSVSDSNLWIQGMATFGLVQCWIMSRGAAGSTTDFTVTGSGYGT